MLNFILMIIAFGLMISVHELGHMLCARAFGVGIEKFSLGFGKPLWEYEHKGTKYRLAWIPLGGYVKMSGENPEDPNPENLERSFSHKTWWKRALIAFSGPFANLLLGMVLFIIAFMLPQVQEDMRPVIHAAKGKWSAVFMPSDSLVTVNGKPVKGFQEFLIGLSNKNENKLTLSRNAKLVAVKIAATDRDSLLNSLEPMVDARIGEVFTGMPAWRAGLKEGDKILEVDSVAISDWYSMRERIIGSPNDQVQLKVQRGNQILQRSIALEKNVTMGERKMIGISQFLPVKSENRYPAGQAVIYGARSTLNFLVMNYVGLVKLFSRPEQLKNNLGGPVMIATMSQQVAQRGFAAHILFFGSISLVLMLMNLLPIPVLDGGHILFAFLEGIFRRPVPLRVQGFLQRIGLALLLMLFVFAFYTDISKLLMRLFALRQ